MTIMAIDPGKNGGYAFAHNGQLITGSMPETESELGKVLREFKQEFGGSVVYLEAVGGFIRGKEDRQPGSAMFNFGRGFGFILGCLEALELPVVLLRPDEWQKPLGLKARQGEAKPSDEKKRQLKAEAIRLYPELARKRNCITLKTCDALLILEVARRRQIPRGERKWRT